MNTRTINTFKITSALILALGTSLILPASTVSAAPKNAVAIQASSKSESRKNTTRSEQDGQLNKQDNQPANAGSPNTVNHRGSVSVPAIQASYVGAQKTHNPAGNNGFIKVNEEVTPDSIPNNDPHVGCNFKVEFYNYDKNPGYHAKVTFALHNPTAGDGYSMNVRGNQNPFIGGDSAGGGNDLDAVEAYKLSFTGKPHPKQGYHVKLTINADGSRGADVKHKVFWVQPCGAGAAGDTAEKPSLPGKTLSTATVKPSGKGGILPSTGAGYMGVALALIAAAATYAGVSRLQKARKVN